MDRVEGLAQDSADARSVILVVEDEFLLRWPVCEYLRDSGFRVIEAASVGEAIAVLSSETRVDVVFSDINLESQADGRELSKWLQAHRPKMPMLLTSGESPPAELTRVRPFIPKPYSLDEVERRLLHMMSQS